MPEILALDGCRPVPLAGYLKALGVLRLVAEQKDADAAGWWEADRFRLRTSLSRKALIDFFLYEYAPTPIIAPWNGGSGFYFQEGKTNERDPLTGKKIKTGVRDQPTVATRSVESVRQSDSGRFQPYREAIEAAKAILDRRQLQQAPSDDGKAELIREMRSTASSNFVAWLDASLAVALAEVKYPPLLGTGGNDGNLDFSANFMQWLGALIGQAGADRTLVDSALFDVACVGLEKSAIGQFAPGRAGGVNSANGTDAEAMINGWDFVLMLEGAVLFAGGVSRRLHEGDTAHLTYPFTVRSAAVGFGTASLPEQLESRGEFWAPLWESPALCSELKAFFREGRITLAAKPAKDGLDAARAIGGLGADRRISSYQRFGFLKRQGLAFLATPLERRRVRPNPSADLLTDLDRDRWLLRVRESSADKNATSSFSAVVHALEEAIFVVLDRPATPEAAQSVLIAIGAIARHLAIRPRLWEKVAPPPLLRGAWRTEADDGSAEFRIAAALSSLVADATKDGAAAFPFASHLGPLNPAVRQMRWADSASLGKARAQVVWGEGSLEENLGALVRRRLIDSAAGRLPEFPFDLPMAKEGERPSAPGARQRLGALTEQIAAIFAVGFDDRRCADLALGLAWTAPRSLGAAPARPAPLPLAFASIAPLIVPQPVLNGALGRDVNAIALPSALPGLLAAGRIAEAVAQAQHRGFVAGLSAPFQRLTANAARGATRADPALGRRILAALAIPLDPRTVKACLRQAYPEDNQEPETNYVD